MKIEPERWALVPLGADAGPRQGEIIGVEWGDADLVAGALTVRRSSWRGIVGTPKRRSTSVERVQTEALKMNIRSLTSPEQREAALAVVRRLIQSEVIKPFRTQRLGKEGKLVEISLTATALVNESGDVYAIFTAEREGKEPNDA